MAVCVHVVCVHKYVVCAHVSVCVYACAHMYVCMSVHVVCVHKYVVCVHVSVCGTCVWCVHKCVWDVCACECMRVHMRDTEDRKCSRVVGRLPRLESPGRRRAGTPGVRTAPPPESIS